MSCCSNDASSSSASAGWSNSSVLLFGRAGPDLVRGGAERRLFIACSRKNVVRFVYGIRPLVPRLRTRHFKFHLDPKKVIGSSVGIFVDYDLWNGLEIDHA